MSAPSAPQSDLRYPLTGILGSSGHVRILRVLAGEPAPQSAPGLAAAAGLSPQGARLVLGALARRRVVLAHGSGRARLYALNPAHPLAAALGGLFEQERRRWDELLESIRAVLARHGPAVIAAWLYGSVARGEDSHDSDLDIAALVGAQTVADRLREDFLSLEDRQSLRISLTALTPQELAALPEDDRWWADVVRDGRVLLGAGPVQARRGLARAAA